MRFPLMLVTITLIFSSCLAFAESPEDLKKNIVLDQRKLVVMENLPLSDEESEKFWPAFRDYQENLYNIERKNVELIYYYLDKYKENSLTDEEASSIVKAYFTLVDNRQKLIKDFSFVLELEKILPVKKIFRYLQIQQNIDALEQYEITKKIPLLE